MHCQWLRVCVCVRHTFGGHADPVEVSSEFLGHVRLTPSWKTHHHNDCGRVGNMGGAGCSQKRAVCCNRTCFQTSACTEWAAVRQLVQTNKQLLKAELINVISVRKIICLHADTHLWPDLSPTPPPQPTALTHIHLHPLNWLTHCWQGHTDC